MISTTKGYDIGLILAAKVILNEILGKQLTIAALALEVGVNTFKSRAAFKNPFKKSIYGYRLDIKLDLARRLLSETELTIAEIAFKLALKVEMVLLDLFKNNFTNPLENEKKTLTPLFDSVFMPIGYISRR